jgi:hypothetical protein
MMKVLGVLVALPVVTVIVLIETARVLGDRAGDLAGPYIDMGRDL